MKQFPALFQFLGGYLHEDWADDYPDLWHAVDDFIDGEPEWAPRLNGEITQLLADCDTEPTLEHALVKLGLVYHPPGDGWDSHHAWLVAVADYVEKHLHKTPAA